MAKNGDSDKQALRFLQTFPLALNLNLRTSTVVIRLLKLRVHTIISYHSLQKSHLNRYSIRILMSLAYSVHVYQGAPTPSDFENPLGSGEPKRRFYVGCGANHRCNGSTLSDYTSPHQFLTKQRVPCLEIL